MVLVCACTKSSVLELHHFPAGKDLLLHRHHHHHQLWHLGATRWKIICCRRRDYLRQTRNFCQPPTTIASSIGSVRLQLIGGRRGTNNCACSIIHCVLRAGAQRALLRAPTGPRYSSVQHWSTLPLFVSVGTRCKRPLGNRTLCPSQTRQATCRRIPRTT